MNDSRKPDNIQKAPMQKNDCMGDNCMSGKRDEEVFRRDTGKRIGANSGRAVRTSWGGPPEQGGLQPIKEPAFPISEGGRFGVKREGTSKKWAKKRNIPTPDCQFFEIYGSKLELASTGNSGQDSAGCIIVFLRIRESLLNGLVLRHMKFFPMRCFSQRFCNIQIGLPDMRDPYFLPRHIGPA